MAERYASFDAGEGKAFEDGKLTLEDLRTIALRDGEPKQISGKQELYEMIVNPVSYTHLTLPTICSV